MVVHAVSDWSKTIDASDSKDVVGHLQDRSSRRFGTALALGGLRLWNAGRQCMNFASGLPVAAIRPR
jgi:hypothetical protein